MHPDDLLDEDRGARLEMCIRDSLKELRQIAGKELRQKSFSGVIIRNQGMIQRILCETDPVSYTHLDVYKRQL